MGESLVETRARLSAYLDPSGNPGAWRSIEHEDAPDGRGRSHDVEGVAQRRGCQRGCLRRCARRAQPGLDAARGGGLRDHEQRDVWVHRSSRAMSWIV